MNKSNKDTPLDRLLETARNIKCTTTACVFYRTEMRCGLTSVYLRNGVCKNLTTKEEWLKIKGQMDGEGVNDRTINPDCA